MAAFDDDELLTPYQRTREAVGLADRGFEAEVASSAARAGAPNPFLNNDRGLAGVAMPVSPAVSSTETAAVPNALVRVQPPFPVETMPVAKQIAWQQLQNKQVTDQAALESMRLKAEADRQQLELRAEQIKQNRELTAEIPKLREALKRSPDDYLDLKAELANRFPIGIGSPEMDRVLGEYEKIYTKKEGLVADVSKAQIARKTADEAKRTEAGYKVAEKLGPVVQREYAALMSEDPNAANKLLAERQREDITANLLAGGLTQQQIDQRYGTGEQFKPQAAQLALKGTMQERREAGREFAFWDKKKKDAAESFGTVSWEPQDEAAWQNSRDYMLSITPTLGGNRAGVQGMEGRPAGPGAFARQSLYRDYQPIAVSPATKQGTAQQAVEPVGTQKVINGVTSVKYPDGKWYKIKQK